MCAGFNWFAQIEIDMIHDSLSSPHRRSQNTSSSSSPYKKQASGFNELGSWSTLLQRHRFLLTMLALLAFLCTIYLYFAVTLGATDSCSGLSGAAKALCRAKSLHEGKLNFSNYKLVAEDYTNY